MAPSKNIQITELQKELLLEHMCKNPELAHNKWTKNLGQENSKTMWEDLAAMLNSQEIGARKDPTNWKDTWSGWKTKTKAKANNILAYKQGKVGGKIPTSQLTDIEKRLLVFIGEEKLLGIKKMPELDSFILSESLPRESVEERVPYATIECAVDPYGEELNATFDGDLQQSSPSEQTKDSPAQLLGSKVTGNKRKIISSTNDAKHSRPEDSDFTPAASALPSIEERTLAAAEKTARSVAALVELCERHASAAERVAGAAERRARAAERMADAAERQALLAETCYLGPRPLLERLLDSIKRNQLSRWNLRRTLTFF